MMTRTVLLLLLPGAAWAQSPPELAITKSMLKEIADEVRKATRVPALGAAIVSSKGLHAIAVSGVRKIGTKAPLVTEDDLWHLGSDSKGFTAMLLAVLAEKKKIDMETTLEKAFPKSAKKMQAGYRTITIDQLLRHKGGLPSNLPGSKGWWVIDAKLSLPVQRAEAAARGLLLKPAETPGEKYHYSNLGYVIAAVAAEQTSKEPYEASLKARVLEPLGIKDAGFGPMGTAGKLDQPLQHDKKGVPREPLLANDNPPVMSPSTRIHMSLKSWSLFAQDHLLGAKGEGKLLSAKGYKRLHEPAEGEGYTPGAWIADAFDGQRMLRHDGSNAGNYCTAVMFPSLDVAILVVTNIGPKPGEDACKTVVRQVVPRLFKK